MENPYSQDEPKPDDADKQHDPNVIPQTNERPLWVSIIVVIAKILVGIIILFFLLFAALFIACVYG